MPTRALLKAFVLFALVARGYAQDVPLEYQPANFRADHSAIIRDISFPNGEQDLFVRVYCEAALSRQGRFGPVYCETEHPDPTPFILAVNTRIHRARLEPARVNGRRASVYFQFTVQFERNGGQEKISLFPHHFFGVQGTGEGFIAAQRYQYSRKLLCRSRFEFHFTMMVPASGGNPTNVRRESGEGSEFCETQLTAHIADGLYIPAFHDGVAVASPNRERWALDYPRQ